MAKHKFGKENVSGSAGENVNSMDNSRSGEQSGASPSGSDGNPAEATSGEEAKTGENSGSSDQNAQNSEETTPSVTEPLTPEQKIAELEAKITDLNDQYLRKAADFDFRKRMNREKQEIIEFANQNLLLDLLPVIDDFERAIKSAETSKDFSSFFEGVSMIEKHLSTQLENKWGLKRFDSEGEVFDPNRHEAIQMEKSPEISEPKVKEDYVKGYLLREKVLRFAKVKVFMPEEKKIEE
ncbi:MAG: nucleotide exchange factor GrpE [Treponema sp.]|nr:nucleotide exchange factor GrpE [Treponema sp.]